MSSPFKKVFGDNITPVMPQAPKQEADRRSSESSVGSSPSYDGRRRSSAAQRFANLEAMKRGNEQSQARRQSINEIYGKPTFIGTLWNNFTRGPVSPPSQK